MECHAREEGCWLESKSDWTIEHVSKAWDKIGEKHIKSKYGGRQSSRKTEISWATTLKNMTAANAFGNNSRRQRSQGIVQVVQGAEI